MAGIYVHVPFCKQACHYCDFHFSTNVKRKRQMVAALAKEITLRRSELQGQQVETIYFGGGTPSVLEVDEVVQLISVIQTNYQLVDNPEITLEANPDDLSEDYIIALAKSPVNRLSIGIQSFFETDLRLMNRSHTAEQAVSSIKCATRYFDNISVDLIYGIPGMDDDQWQSNIEKAVSFGLPHISSYALTVEPKTALKKFIAEKLIPEIDDEQAERQFHLLVAQLGEVGYVNYETSNFGKPGFFSKNNTAYWQGKSYLGIGPSAHSFDGEKRGWNLRNNIKYMQALAADKLPITYETLSRTDRYNEYVMTGLRTIWGVSLQKVEHEFGKTYGAYLHRQAIKYIEQKLLFWDGDILLATKKGKFLVDGIASDLFMVNLS
ncbi:MAG: radical SAM family heme chaperone HemW [Allomuricauda sp.]|nr:MAG: radical SAM family heme chaperone HemW [Allomuricauda sp.]